MSDIAIGSKNDLSQSLDSPNTNIQWDDWVGWPGEPYDHWNPASALVPANNSAAVRGWCYVQNNSEIPIQVREAGSPNSMQWVGNSILVVDAIAPDGTKLHVVTDYPLSRGGTDFFVTLTKKFSKNEQKEVYCLTVRWENGYRERYEEKKAERIRKGQLKEPALESLQPPHVRIGERRLAEMSLKG